MTNFERIKKMDIHELANELLFLGVNPMDLVDGCNEETCPKWKECNQDENEVMCLMDDIDFMEIYLEGEKR